MAKKRQATARADPQKRKKAKDARQTRQSAASSTPPEDYPSAEQDDNPTPTTALLPSSPPVSQPVEKEPEEDPEPAAAPLEDSKTGEAVIVFQCANCRSVVGDTTTAYTADMENCTISLSAACGVTLDNTLAVSSDGHDAGCAFKALLCSQCETPLGRVYASTTPQLDSCRSTYTLDTSALTSYELGACKTLDGGPAPPSASGQALRAHAEQRPAPPVESKAEINVVEKQMAEALEKVSGQYTAMADKVAGINQALTQNQDMFDNVHRMFFIWEERFASFQRCEQRMNKLMTERRVQDRRLLPPNPSPPREPSQQARGVQVVEPGPNPAVSGLPGIASNTPRRPLSAQRKRRT